ncbi:MAG: redoxin domain-containing protein [bacterium]|nr:redoxin domain-containing protein [bacterium]
MSRMARSLTVGTVTLTMVVLTMTVAPAGLRAEEPVKQKAKTKAQIVVGDIAPDFTLPDPDGTAQTLSDLRGLRNILLVFNRGSW